LTGARAEEEKAKKENGSGGGAETKRTVETGEKAGQEVSLRPPRTPNSKP